MSEEHHMERPEYKPAIFRVLPHKGLKSCFVSYPCLVFRPHELFSVTA